jgi:hypothetical protein
VKKLARQGQRDVFLLIVVCFVTPCATVLVDSVETSLLSLPLCAFLPSIAAGWIYVVKQYDSLKSVVCACSIFLDLWKYNRECVLLDG